MRTIGIIVLLVMGAIVGFVTIFALLPDDKGQMPARAVPAFPVNLELSFSTRDTRSGSLGIGWGESEAWGVWSKGAEAIALVQLLGRAAGDVVLLVEGRGRPSQPPEKSRVTVEVNGTTVGVWQLTANDQQFASFTVTAGVTDREVPLRITFRSETPIFGLRRLLLRDVSLLSEFAGVVDLCQPTRIVGWAKVENYLSPLIIRRGGRVLTPTAFQNVNRPDLPGQRLPAGAGFDIELPLALDPTETTDVLFPNGAHLGNSPCRASR